MNDQLKTKPVLILGGKGKTGSRVAERLIRRGYPVRSVSRSTTMRFDWDDMSTWAPVVKGVSAVYITYQPDLAVPGAVEAVRSFAELAIKAGVRRMVLLSGRGEEEAQRAEKALQETGADWTIVRASWFFQNFSESFLLDAVLSGEVALPVGGTKEPFVDADDIADVVVEALTNDSHIGQLYEVTGPELLSFTDLLQEISTASGRNLTFKEVTASDYASLLASHEVPPEYVELVLYLFTTVLDGRNETTCDGVQRALGRAPLGVREYALKTVRSGIWAA